MPPLTFNELEFIISNSLLTTLVTRFCIMKYPSIGSLLPGWMRHSRLYSIIVTDLEGKYLYVNDLFLEKFSFITDCFIGKPSTIAILPDDIGVCEIAVQQLFAQNGTPVTVRLRKPSATGSDFIWTEWEFSLFPDPQGSVVGVLCVGYDVTETAKASISARASAEKLEHVVSEVHEGYLFINEQQTIEAANNAAATMLHHPLEQVIHQPLKAFFPIQSYGLLYEQLDMVHQSSKSASWEAFFPGYLSWFQVVIYPAVGGYNLFLTDITQRKEAERALIDSEIKYRELIEYSHDIIFTLTLEGVFTFVSPSWSIILGHNIEDVIGRTFTQFVHPDDLPKCFDFITHVYQSKQRQGGIEYRALHLDGSWHWHTTNATPVLDEQGKVVSYHGVARDITAQKNAELNLAFQTKRLENILEGTNAGTWEWNINTNECTFNERWALLLGYKLEELMPTNYQTWADMVHPQDLPGAINTVSKYLKGEITYYELECRMKHKDGHWVWILKRGRITEYDSAGRPTLMAGTNLDITARKHAEEQLRQMSLVAQKTNSGVVITNHHNEITWVNESFEKLTGYSSAELIGKNPRILQGIDTSPVHVAQIRQHLQHTQPFTQELLNYAKDGRPYWIELSITPVLDEAGVPMQFIGIEQDITERKDRERKLKESEVRLQKTIEAIPHPFMTVDDTGIILFVNDEFEKVFGYKSHEALGQNIEFLIPERFRGNHERHRLGYMHSGGASIRMGSYLCGLKKDGSEIAVNISLNTFTIAGKQSVIVIMQDVTALKNYQDTILAQNKRLREIAWRQSHEVRRSVANILGLCELMRQDKIEPNVALREHLNYLNQSAVELDNIIRLIVNDTDMKNEPIAYAQPD